MGFGFGELDRRGGRLGRKRICYGKSGKGTRNGGGLRPGGRGGRGVAGAERHGLYSGDGGWFQCSWGEGGGVEDFILVKNVGGVGKFLFRNPGVFFGRISFPSDQE